MGPEKCARGAGTRPTKAAMPTRKLGSFRFFDLPGELRNRIYQKVLCSFEPPIPDENMAGLKRVARLPGQGIERVPHNIDTTILRTCKQIHREAYDIMVKTNQFVRVKTLGIPMQEIMIPVTVPVVTLAKTRINQFKGYIMLIDLCPYTDPDQGDASEPHAPHTARKRPRWNFMILRRDLDKFCTMLSQADGVTRHDSYGLMSSFSPAVQVNVRLNMYPRSLPDWKAPIDEYFSEKNQEALLAPFRTHMRGFSHFCILGKVDRKVAEDVAREIAQPQWTDPAGLLKDLKAVKEAGNAAYKSSNIQQAIEEWTDVVIDIRRVAASTSFPILVSRGGPEFATEFAELYFTGILNLAQGVLSCMQSLALPPEPLIAQGLATTSELEYAPKIPAVFQRHGSTFIPSNSQGAKLCYRQAVCWRLLGQATLDPGLMDMAINAAKRALDSALEFAPDDALINKEKREFTNWWVEYNLALEEQEEYEEGLSMEAVLMGGGFVLD